MWLLDVNMPKKVGEILADRGFESHATDDKEWGALKNGMLVETAVRAGFQASAF
jgi:hypothetical protein